MTILIVDDDQAVGMLLRAVLNEVPGWGAVVVGHPRAALAVLEHMVVDALVVDVDLPDIRGPELVARLRELPYWTNPPVILMSASQDPPDAQRAVRRGCAARFIQKPFDIEDVVSVLRGATGGARPARAA